MLIHYLDVYNQKVGQARKVKPSYKDCKIINKLYRWICTENELRQAQGIPLIQFDGQ
jgi:hypothetical protein